VSEENKLLGPCLKLLRAELAVLSIKRGIPGPVIIKHADSLTSGGPDVSVTWFGMTSWWEFKTGDRVHWKNALQQLTCRRLAAAGECRVVLYEEIEEERRTVILTPDEKELAAVAGFDNQFILSWVTEVHCNSTKSSR
jgi:hypothetical protein